MRILLLKISATVAMLIAGGCGLPDIGQKPFPQPKTEPQIVRIEVVGEGAIKVGGDATITAKGSSSSEPSRVCDCGCGMEGCTCSRGPSSAASTASKIERIEPQFVLKTVCENGVCRVVRVEVPTPTASVSKRLASPQTQRGIVIYDNGSPAGRAMRNAIGSNGVDWKHSDSPIAINGIRWTPTAVKPDGSAWTPGASGWHSGSEGQFRAWLNNL